MVHHRAKTHCLVPPLVSQRADNIYPHRLLDSSLWPLRLLLSAHPFGTWSVCLSPSVMPSTVSPCSPVQPPTLRKSVQMTCALASSSSIAVDVRFWINEVHPPAECIRSEEVIKVHSLGIPKDLPGSLPPHFHTLGLQSQQSIALQVYATIPGLVPRQLLSVSSSHSVSTVTANLCMNMPSQWIMYFSYPIAALTSNYWPFSCKDTTHQLNLHAFNWCGIRWSPGSDQMVLPPVVLWILRIPTTIEIESSPLFIYKPSLYAILQAHIHLHLMATNQIWLSCLTNQNTVGTDGSLHTTIWFGHSIRCWQSLLTLEIMPHAC